MNVIGGVLPAILHNQNIPNRKVNDRSFRYHHSVMTFPPGDMIEASHPWLLLKLENVVVFQFPYNVFISCI